MRNEPRISIIKLMEYMHALPSRQREIVDNQKNPLANKPKMTWCANARKKIVEYFESGCTDESILDNEIERLQAAIETLEEKDPKKLKSRIRKLQVEIDAINSFKGLQEKLNLKGVRYSKALNKPRHLDYSGVHVSVRPEVIVTTRGTWEPIGCMKLYLTKNDRLKDPDADLMCAVLSHYTNRYLRSSQPINPRACVVIDVFGQRVFTASQNVEIHEGSIKKHCRNIHETWLKTPNRKPISGDENDQGELGLSE